MLLGLAVLWAALAVSAAHPLRSRASASKYQHKQLAARGPQSQYTPPSLDFAAVKGDGDIKSSAYKRLTDMLPTVLSNGNQVTKHSWEIGAYTQALLEVYNPNLTPFRYDPSAEEKYDRAPWAVLRISQASLYAVDWSGAPSSASGGAGQGAKPKLGDYLEERKNGETGVYAAPLIPGDGSLGDPAALGVATWILAQFSRGKNVQDFLGRGARTPEQYAWAVGAQLQMLREGVHSQNGTISQREDHFELWADQGFMIPPFAAHLGMATRSLDLLGMALHQWALESSALLDPAQNLFRHVNGWDARFWATGNGWMLLGAIRTLASTWSATSEGTFWDMANPIINTLDKVFAALFDQLDDDSLLPNYMLQHDSQAAIGDAAGTAAVVAAFYRYADLFPWHVGSGVQAKAEKAFDGVMAKVNGTGWLTQVVDPMGTNGFMVWPERQQVSPEGQTFLGMMWAARTAAGF